jgi:hypothetical protein
VRYLSAMRFSFTSSVSRGSDISVKRTAVPLRGPSAAYLGRDGCIRGDFAFAPQPLRRGFIEPRERDPERKSDCTSDQDPARGPVRRAQRRPELRVALRQRSHRAGVQHACAQHIAALELGEEGWLFGHRFTPKDALGVATSPAASFWNSGSSRRRSKSGSRRRKAGVSGGIKPP